MMTYIKKGLIFAIASLVILQQAALPVFAHHNDDHNQGGQPKDVIDAQLSVASIIEGGTIIIETKYQFEADGAFETTHENGAQLRITIDEVEYKLVEVDNSLKDGIFTYENSTITYETGTGNNTAEMVLIPGSYELTLTYPKKPQALGSSTETLLVTEDDTGEPEISEITAAQITLTSSGPYYENDTVTFETAYEYFVDPGVFTPNTEPEAQVDLYYVYFIGEQEYTHKITELETDDLQGNYEIVLDLASWNEQAGALTITTGTYKIVVTIDGSGITSKEFTVIEKEIEIETNITSGQITLVSTAPFYTGTTLSFATAYQYGTSTSFIAETITSSTISLWYQTEAPLNFVPVEGTLISAIDEEGNYSLAIPTSTILSWENDLGTYKLSLQWPVEDTLSEAVYSDTFTITTQTAEPVIPTITFASETSSVNEDVGTVQITVELSEVSDEDTVVAYTLGGNATSPADYTVSPTGEITIPAGSTTTMIMVTIVNDTIVETVETITFTLSEVTSGNATVIADASVHTLTITDNDVAPTTGGSTGGGGGVIAGNAPIANAGPDLAIIAGSSALLDGSGSTDLDNNIRFWVWNFGDGSAVEENADQATTSHVFATPGVYTVTLIVIDATGLTSSDTATVTVVSGPAQETPVAEEPGEETTPPAPTPVITPTTPTTPGGTGGSTAPVATTPPGADSTTPTDTTPDASEEAEVVVATPENTDVTAQNTGLISPGEEAADEEAPEWVRIAFGSGALLAALGAGVWINRVRKLV